MNIDYKGNIPGGVSINKVIDVESMRTTCYGFPIVFDFVDKSGLEYNFRLRHGGARIVCETTDETLLLGSMADEFDGVCEWDDMVKWALENGIVIKY